MKKILIASSLFLALTAPTVGQDLTSDNLAEHGRGWYDSYTASDGYTYRPGDTLRIGFPSGGNRFFSYLTYGDGLLVPIQPLPAAAAGREVFIGKIAVVGTKRSGYVVQIRTTGMSIGNYTIALEAALSTGEVKGWGMTSDEALSLLKKAKDKLDLGLITQDEFESKKAELSKYIK